MVPSGSDSSSPTASPSGSTSHSVHDSIHTLPTSEQLEALRVDTLRAKYSHPALTTSAQSTLMTRLLRDSETNRSYKPAQLAFVSWALSQSTSVSLNNFSGHDLVNFLSFVHTERHLQVPTLKVWRSAILRFHHMPSTVRSDPLLLELLGALTSTAPPVRIHRLTVDLSPTLNHLSSITNTACPLAQLQAKTAFLLGMAAFLRRSDLARINLLSAHINMDEGSLFSEIVSPKETRQGFRIIKPVLVHPHADSSLCPVAAFLTLRDHPRTSQRPPSVIFVNSKRPYLAAAPRTIGSWLSRLIHLSTSEPPLEIIFGRVCRRCRIWRALDKLMSKRSNKLDLFDYFFVEMIEWIRFVRYQFVECSPNSTSSTSSTC